MEMLSKIKWGEDKRSAKDRAGASLTETPWTVDSRSTRLRVSNEGVKPRVRERTKEKKKTCGILNLMMLYWHEQDDHGDMI